MAALLAACCATTFPAGPWAVSSLSGQHTIVITLAEGQPTWRVLRHGREILTESPLGLRGRGLDLASGLTCIAAPEPVTVRQRYELWCGPRSHVDSAYRLRRLSFSAAGGRFDLLVAAGDAGVALAYDVIGPPRLVAMEAEETGLALPTGARGWLQPYHAAGDYTPAYEDYYAEVTPGTPPPRSRAEPRGWAMPALFNVPGAGWALVAETSRGPDYPGCHLVDDGPAGRFLVRHAELDERTPGVPDDGRAEVSGTLPWRLPWRVVCLADAPRELLESTWVTDLAPPCRIADTTWIRPGRASWGWWSRINGPYEAAFFGRYATLAADFGWEYTLFDAGWWDTDLASIAADARRQGVLPWAWTAANDCYDPVRRRRKLDEFADAGIVGAKIDFWCSDRQAALTAMWDTLADAAARRMMVVFHGCTVPRGWQRTWPNLLSCEAVLGAESYHYEPRHPAEAARLNCVLPFSRNVVGPVDITPLGLTPQRFARTTTAAHELAAALAHPSGILHFADAPEAYAALDGPVRQLLRELPVRWDATRGLAGEPGRLVIVARRAGETWYIAGLNGDDTPREVALPLTDFPQRSRRIWYAEGEPPAMSIATGPIAAGASAWRHTMPPRAGFVLRLRP